MNIKEDLRFNIERANDIIRLYEDRKRVFLEINLVLVTIFSVIIGLWFENEIINDIARSWILFWFAIQLICTVINIIWNLIPNKTTNIKNTICKGYTDRQIDEINVGPNSIFFTNDYKQQLKNLNKFQKNYSDIASITRWITFYAMILFVTGMGGSLIINYYPDIVVLGIVIVVILLSFPLIFEFLRYIRKKHKSISEKKKKNEQRIKSPKDEKNNLKKRIDSQKKSQNPDT